MNETPERQNNGSESSQGRFSLNRLAQTRPSVRPVSKSPARPATKPGGENEAGRDKTDASVDSKPSTNIARRPVPVQPAARPPAPPREPTQASNQAAQRTNSGIRGSSQGDKIATGMTVNPDRAERGARDLAPGPGRIEKNGSGTTPGTGQATRGYQPAVRTSPVARPNGNGVNGNGSTGTVPAGAITPAPISLPTGIQRGFSRPLTDSRPDPGQPVISPRTTIAAEPVYEPIRETAGEPTGEKVEKAVEEAIDVKVVVSHPPVRLFEPVEAAVETPDVNLAAAGPVPLEVVLSNLSAPPAQTAVLGVCDDGLPILIDLTDPTPGALLVTGDDELLRRRLLRTVLQSAAALNSPRNVQFILLSTRPAEWRQWMEGQDVTRQCLGVESLPGAADEPEGSGSPERWLVKLAGWADQRRNGSITGPAVLLIVDDLEAVTRLEYDARVNFDWLVKEGPAVRIWPVVALRTAAAKDMTRWVRLFKTRLLGFAEDETLLGQLGGNPDLRIDPTQFAVRVQDTWLKFRIPILPDEVMDQRD